MIVYTLSCSHEHAFDGWFRSGADFERQADGRQIACPVCGDTHVTRQLSAPRINTGAAPEGRAQQDDGPQDVMAGSMMAGLQEHMLREFKSFVRTNTEDVGAAFAETARRMHYGEEHHRNIRGRVSTEEARELRDEGIETVQLPPGITMDGH